MQELRHLQKTNRQLEEEVKRLQQTMMHSMVDHRDMEAALHRAEEEVRAMAMDTLTDSHIHAHAHTLTGTLEASQEATRSECSPSTAGVYVHV